jgi:hypothetical protein
VYAPANGQRRQQQQQQWQWRWQCQRQWEGEFQFGWGGCGVGAARGWRGGCGDRDRLVDVHAEGVDGFAEDVEAEDVDGFADADDTSGCREGGCESFRYRLAAALARV